MIDVYGEFDQGPSWRPIAERLAKEHPQPPYRVRIDAPDNGLVAFIDREGVLHVEKHTGGRNGVDELTEALGKLTELVKAIGELRL